MCNIAKHIAFNNRFHHQNPSFVGGQVKHVIGEKNLQIHRLILYILKTVLKERIGVGE